MSTAPLQQVSISGPQPAADRRARTWLLVCVIAGMGLRLWGYLANRSLWGDEASLGLNIVPRTFGQLARPLTLNQQASLGFRFLLKVATLAISRDAYGLRFFPMVAAVASVAAMALAARRLLKPVPAVVAVALFAFNPWLIAYGAECKAYSIEVLAAALALWLALRVMDGGDPAPRLVTLALATAALAWLGTATVFVVAGTWIVVTLWIFTNRRTCRVPLFCLACAAAVMASTLASLWVTWLEPKVMAFQLDAWTKLDAWPPTIWTSWRAAAWFPQEMMRFFRQTGGFTLPALAAGLFVVGTVAMARRKVWNAGLVLAPAVLVVAAGLLHKYPLAGVEWSGYLPSSSRVLLFLTPAVSILIAAGLGALGLENPRRGPFGVGLVLLVLLVFSPVATTVERFIWPPQFQDMRAAWLAIAAQIREGDAVYVNPGGTSALEYYAAIYPAGVQFPWLTGHDATDITEWLDRNQAQGHFIHHLWVMLVWYQEWFRGDLPATQARIEQAIAGKDRMIQHEEALKFADVYVDDYTLGQRSRQ